MSLGTWLRLDDEKVFTAPLRLRKSLG
jgi:hypothetical protein